jgi:hypothetical protein
MTRCKDLPVLEQHKPSRPLLQALVFNCSRGATRPPSGRISFFSLSPFTSLTRHQLWCLLRLSAARSSLLAIALRPRSTSQPIYVPKFDYNFETRPTRHIRIRVRTTYRGDPLNRVRPRLKLPYFRLDPPPSSPRRRAPPRCYHSTSVLLASSRSCRAAQSRYRDAAELAESRVS